MTLLSNKNGLMKVGKLELDFRTFKNFQTVSIFQY